MAVLTYCQHEQHTMLRHVVLCGGGWWGGRGVWVSVRQQSCWWPEVHCSGGGSLSDHSQHPDQDSSTPPSTTSHQSADKVTPHSPSIPTHPCVCLERPITNFQAPRGVPSLPHYSPNMREKRVWPQLREIQTWSKSTGHWLLFWSRPRPLRWSVLAAGDSRVVQCCTPPLQHTGWSSSG